MTEFHPTGSPDRFEDDLAALAELLDGAEPAAGAGTTPPPRAPGAPTPMSFAQELLWMLDRASPGLTAYNMPSARRLRGALNVNVLRECLTNLVARHELLRTRFAEVEGAPRLLVDAPSRVEVAEYDLTDLPESSREVEARHRVGALGTAQFDLAHEHLFRAVLLRLAPDDHILLLASHHIVVDGWSLGLIWRELGQEYAALVSGRPPGLATPRIQFGDYATWERERLQGPVLEELLAFWREHLGNAIEPLDLPTDHPRPVTPTFEGARRSRLLSTARVDALEQFGRERGLTLYMMLLAAYGVVLHRYTGRDQILIGSGSAGRTQDGMEDIVGFLNNTLVQRVDCSGDPQVPELLRRVRDSALAAHDHQAIPLEKLVLELRTGQDRLAHAPLFDVVLTMQDVGDPSTHFGALEVEPFGFEAKATKFDITLLPARTEGGLRLSVQYRADLFDPATMERFLHHLDVVLEAMVRDPGRTLAGLPLLAEDEVRALAAWNATDTAMGPPATLVELVDRAASRHADRPAVVAGDAHWSFQELSVRSHALAWRLAAQGVNPGDPVGLLLDRGANAVAGLLGIMKAGGAFVPLSIDAPPARLAAQLQECRAKVVVTDAAHRGALPGGVDAVILDDDGRTTGTAPIGVQLPPIRPADLAYILYTSGSTGIPKGVAITHANAVHYVRAISRVLADLPPETEGDGLGQLAGHVFAMVSTFAADLGNTVLLPALCGGGTLHVLSAEVATEPARFADYLAQHPIDVLKITPSHLGALSTGRSGDDLAAILPATWLVLGGEMLQPAFARALLAAGRSRVLNHYGPTECTVGACTFEVTANALAEAERAGAQSVPIGGPLANVRALVVDGHGAELPVGIPGELWLGGAGVAVGYFHREDLTTAKFVSRHDGRYYRTGDRSRRLPGGAIEFLGRTDHQVKIRGYRVELGEIEQVLLSHPGVAQALVIQQLRPDAESRLVAYVVPRSGGYAVSHADRPTTDRLMAWLEAALPEYMIPSALMLLDAMPLTSNGKVDRRALPDPNQVDAEGEGMLEPQTETERQLAIIWAEVLKKDRVGRRDNFLALGGHSLMAIRVLGRISRTFGVRLPLRTLFDAPTVEALAGVVEQERAKPASAPSISARAREAHRIVPSGDGTPGGTSGGGAG